MIPGEYKLQGTAIVCNEGKQEATLFVTNRGDRPVQVGSHFHFAEVNASLEFEREKAFGMRLNIPAGTAVRFEPGDGKPVALIPFSGTRHVYGLNNGVNGALDKEEHS